MKIYGNNSEERFAYLEKVLPKMAAQIGVPEKIVIPGTLITDYCKEVNDVLFSVLLFAGKVERIAFAYENAISSNGDKVELNVTCHIGNSGHNQSFVFKTSKAGAVYTIDISVEDGDTIKIVNNNKNITFYGLNVSLLYLPRRRVVDKEATRRLLEL